MIYALVEPDVQHTTALLVQFAHGDEAARERLYHAVRDELRALAGGLMAHDQAARTLQPTALVHEAWIRLVSGKEQTFENRRHFLGVAGKAMRSVLIDHVRGKRTRKRGGGLARQTLDEAVETLMQSDAELLDLDQALRDLQRDDPELAQIVDLRFFCGLTHPEIATALGISLSKVERMWRIARARLHRSLGSAEAGDDALG